MCDLHTFVCRSCKSGVSSLFSHSEINKKFVACKCIFICTHIHISFCTFLTKTYLIFVLRTVFVYLCFSLFPLPPLSCSSSILPGLPFIFNLPWSHPPSFQALSLPSYLLLFFLVSPSLSPLTPFLILSCFFLSSLLFPPSYHLLLCSPAVSLLYLPSELLSFPVGPDTLGSDG